MTSQSVITNLCPHCHKRQWREPGGTQWKAFALSSVGDMNILREEANLCAACSPAATAGVACVGLSAEDYDL